MRRRPTVRRLAGLLPFLACWFAIAAWAQEPAAAPEAAADAAGTVELSTGDVRIYGQAKTPRPVKTGDGIAEGESIVTGADGELHLQMADGGIVAVRPNTRLRITAYRARGDDQDKGVLSLLVGSFRSITGWIGKSNPRAYQIRTPTATIGVRGTDHEPLVIPQGSSEGEPGTYDKVNSGASYIETAQGTVEVPERRAAFAPWGGRGVRPVPPRLLEGIPGFFRPTRNEHLLERRHEAIQHLLEQRRLERRHFFEQHPGLRGPLAPGLRAQALEQRRALRQERLRAPEHRPLQPEHPLRARELPAGPRLRGPAGLPRRPAG